MFNFIDKYFSSPTREPKEIVISLMESLGDIDCINNGGCLFAAYAVYLKSKELGIQGVSIIHLDWFHDSIKTNKAFLRGDVHAPVSGNHYLIKIEGELVDSNGIQDTSGYNKLEISNDADIERFCVSALLSTGQWNPRFNRRDGVKKIKKILGVDLTHCL